VSASQKILIVEDDKTRAEMYARNLSASIRHKNAPTQTVSRAQAQQVLKAQPDIHRVCIGGAVMDRDFALQTLKEKPAA
jgi:precorrin-6B methylase 2